MPYSNILLSLKEKYHVRKFKLKEKELICLKCGAKLIKRISKFDSSFWYGCSRFPMCKYTVKEKHLSRKNYKL